MIEPPFFSMCAQSRENFVVYLISYSLPNLVFLNSMRFISTTRAHAMRPYRVLRLTDLLTYDLLTYDLRLTDYHPITLSNSSRSPFSALRWCLRRW